MSPSARVHLSSAGHWPFIGFPFALCTQHVGDFNLGKIILVVVFLFYRKPELHDSIRSTYATNIAGCMGNSVYPISTYRCKPVFARWTVICVQVHALPADYCTEARRWILFIPAVSDFTAVSHVSPGNTVPIEILAKVWFKQLSFEALQVQKLNCYYRIHISAFKVSVNEPQRSRDGSEPLKHLSFQTTARFSALADEKGSRF